MTTAEVSLRHCLSARTRRWVVAEFFCSTIDRPYFMRSELQVLHFVLNVFAFALCSKGARNARA